MSGDITAAYERLVQESESPDALLDAIIGGNKDSQLTDNLSKTQPEEAKSSVKQQEHLALFDPVIPKGADANKPNGSTFSDPAFSSNKNAPIHRWVPWIAGFSYEFVQDAIVRHLRHKGTVLDPFAGVGTTLVTAVLAGHDAIGFEINPYAALACRTKLRSYRIGPRKLNDHILSFNKFYSQAIRDNYSPRSEVPSGFKTRSAFYSPPVLRKVLIVLDFIKAVEDEGVHDLFKLAFGSTMIKYSNYSYEPSLGRRSAAGKSDIEDFPVGETISGKLREMVQDIVWMRQKMDGKAPSVELVAESFFDAWSALDANTVDLIVTSPPYLNNYHYNRNTRPHLYWLGYVSKPSDSKHLEEQNFGKYWQTVRERERIELDFDPGNGDIAESLELLRGKTPEKGIYGGNGWANYAAAYFNDCHRFTKAAKYLLKRNATALVVIGNSILQGVMIPTDRFLAKIAESVGLQVINIHVPRATRVGNSIIQSDVRVAKAKDSHQLYEAVVELRKP